MNTREARKAAIAAYKERRAPSGVFVVRCAASDECWVGSSPVLDKIKNRIWFTLRQGGSPHRTLQEAWNSHGPDTFAFEVLEELPDDVSDFARAGQLAERVEHWREELGAQGI